MRGHVARARLLLQTRHYEDAESALRRALAAQPDDSGAHALLERGLPRRRFVARSFVAR